MNKELILSMTMSLDGFAAGPNREIDWIHRSISEEGRQRVAEQMSQVGLIAMGHRSYQDMADFWPSSPNPIARAMNEIPKAVFSRSGTVTPPKMEKTTAALNSETPGDSSAIRAALESWLHPVVAGADLVSDVQRMKAEDGKPIHALGGVSFASSLVAANLVDVFRFVVHPIALGRGLSIFAELEAPLLLKLEDVLTFKSGVVVKTYRPG